MHRNILVLDKAPRCGRDVVVTLPDRVIFVSVSGRFPDLDDKVIEKDRLGFVTIDNFVTNEYDAALAYLKDKKPGLVVSRLGYTDGCNEMPSGFELLRRMQRENLDVPTFVCIGPYGPNMPWNNIVHAALLAYSRDALPDGVLPALQDLMHGAQRELGDGQHGEGRVFAVLPQWSVPEEAEMMIPYVVKEYTKMKDKQFTPIDYAETKARDNLHFLNDPELRLAKIYAYFFPHIHGLMTEFQEYIGFRRTVVVSRRRP